MSDGFRQFLTILGLFWATVVLSHFGSIRNHFGLFQAILGHFETNSNHFGPFRFIFGYFQPIWVISDHFGTITDHFEVYLTIFVNLRSFRAILSHVRPYWTFLEHFRSSKVILGHMRPYWSNSGPCCAITDHFGPFRGHLGSGIGPLSTCSPPVWSYTSVGVYQLDYFVFVYLRAPFP